MYFNFVEIIKFSILSIRL